MKRALSDLLTYLSVRPICLTEITNKVQWTETCSGQNGPRDTETTDQRQNTRYKIQ